MAQFLLTFPAWKPEDIVFKMNLLNLAALAYFVGAAREAEAAALRQAAEEVRRAA